MIYICPLCHSNSTQAEGSLGDRLHLRCRDCGTWFSRKNKSARRKSLNRRQERRAKERLYQLATTE